MTRVDSMPGFARSVRPRAAAARPKTAGKPMAKKKPTEKPATDPPFAPPAVSTADAIPEGKVPDFLTRKHVKDTAEEYVRQNLEKALVRQYKYAPSDCQPEFRITKGSAKPRIDVAVFLPGQEHKQENVFLIVETKEPRVKRDDKDDGIEQLWSYLSFCPNAQYGLWTNGDDRVCYAKRVVKGKNTYEEIVDIPAAGQSENDAARPQHKNLMPATADNLLFAFRRCHNYVAGVQGIHKQNAFWELLKLIFCKIEDERSKTLAFFVAPSELGGETSAAPAQARLNKLMAEKVVSKYPTIWDQSDRVIKLKASVIAYVVSQLQRYSLLKSSVDVKGIAYEEVVGENLRGNNGEFFTPRNACRMAVQMLNPQDGETLLDPACGTGGFLITAMNHALHQLELDEKSKWDNPDHPTDAERDELFRRGNAYLQKRVFGFDYNADLVRAAKMNMVMNNDGEGGLFQADSLAHPHTWEPQAAKQVPLGSIDVLFTNPPFGANIKVEGERLEQYELGAVWDQDASGRWSLRRDANSRPVLQKSQPPEILFIERCLQFLRPETGRMAMVIPNGILNNPALGYVRTWLLTNAQVIAVVDMARELFQPNNDTQTSMVLLRRLSEAERKLAQEKGLDYPVFMAVAERIGHDKRRNPIYRRHPDGQDVVTTRPERDVVIDPNSGREKVIEIEVRDRMIDDELPEVAEAFRKWQADQSNS
jgi:type I restriction enzyme M protein